MLETQQFACERLQANTCINDRLKSLVISIKKGPKVQKKLQITYAGSDKPNIVENLWPLISLKLNTPE